MLLYFTFFKKALAISKIFSKVFSSTTLTNSTLSFNTTKKPIGDKLHPPPEPPAKGYDSSFFIFFTLPYSPPPETNPILTFYIGIIVAPSLTIG